MLQLVTTADGSATIYNTEIGEHYHSKHGALQESRHVFLNSGLKFYLDNNPETKQLNLLEIGLGTGLNFLLSADWCTKLSIKLDYTAIEAHPLSEEMISSTGYGQYIPFEIWNAFIQQYPPSFNTQVSINGFCKLQTAVCNLSDFSSDTLYDLLYFDAFAAVHQPEMWTNAAIEHACSFLKPGGIFVTYAITGNLKRCLKALGFNIEKAPGAPGKREMLRATK